MTSSMSSPIRRVSIFRFSRDDAIQVENLGREHLLAAEGQQLASERGGAFGGVGDFLRWPTQRRIVGRALEQKFAVARDDHQADC